MPKRNVYSFVVYRLNQSSKNIWIFPIILAVCLLLLTIFKVHGSSIGVYHSYFYGDTNDSSLIFGKPRAIRSDEFVVNTQMTLAQTNNDLKYINENIGDGQNMSVVVDVPYKEWSQLFKPHNWAFFVLPFDNAFAFKWWFMAYLLMISCYFFTLAFLPGKNILAIGLAIGLYFSPFIQWWYQFITIGPIYYILFIATIFLYFAKAKKLRDCIILGVALAYTSVCFALVLYPPFQIPCALAVAAFSTGIVIERLQKMSKKESLQKICVVSVALLLAGVIILLFIHTRSDVIQSIQNTTYPGKRVVTSGGFDKAHLLSGNTSFQLQFGSKANNYVVPNTGIRNQSEASNFILLQPFLFLPTLLLIYILYRKHKVIDWPLVFVNGMFIVMLAWLYVPHLGILGKLFFLEYVPLTRTIIGLGVLNIFQIVLVVRRLTDHKLNIFSKLALPYSLLVFLCYVLLGNLIVNRFPGYIGLQSALLFAVPIPLAIYLVLKNRPSYAIWTIAFFAAFSTFAVNPLYRGMKILSSTPLSNTIKSLSDQDSGKWAIEEVFIENFVSMNGASTISGVYFYPQLDLWKNFSSKEDQETYNRYAHTNFTFDRKPFIDIETKIELTNTDHFGINTEPCSTYIREQGIRFLLTVVELAKEDNCTSLVDTIIYPKRTFYIYEVK